MALTGLLRLLMLCFLLSFAFALEPSRSPSTSFKIDAELKSNNLEDDDFFEVGYYKGDYVGRSYSKFLREEEIRKRESHHFDSDQDSSSKPSEPREPFIPRPLAYLVISIATYFALKASFQRNIDTAERLLEETRNDLNTVRESLIRAHHAVFELSSQLLRFMQGESISPANNAADVQSSLPEEDSVSEITESEGSDSDCEISYNRLALLLSARKPGIAFVVRKKRYNAFTIRKIHQTKNKLRLGRFLKPSKVSYSDPLQQHGNDCECDDCYETLHRCDSSLCEFNCPTEDDDSQDNTTNEDRDIEAFDADENEEDASPESIVMSPERKPRRLPSGLLLRKKDYIRENKLRKKRPPRKPNKKHSKNLNGYVAYRSFGRVFYNSDYLKNKLRLERPPRKPNKKHFKPYNSRRRYGKISFSKALPKSVRKRMF